MGENTRGGVRVNREREWKRFDALPPEIRKVYAAAPFDYALARADGQRKAWANGQLALSAWRRELIAMMCDTTQAMALKTYGPDHPDAERSRLERRA